jgi:hypothetical protein
MKRPVKDLAFAANSAWREELPKDGILEYIDVLVTGTVDTTGTPTHVEDILHRCELQVNGKPMYDLTGRQLAFLDASLQGERIEEILTDPGAGTSDFAGLFRLWIADPTSRVQPERTLLNLKLLDALALHLEFGSGDDLFTAGAHALTNPRVRVYYGEASANARGGDILVVNRSFSYVLTGGRTINEWKEAGATLRAMLVELVDDTGAPIDTGLTEFGLNVDGKTPILDNLDFAYVRPLTTFDTGLSPAEIDVGQAYVDLDPGSKGKALQGLDGVTVNLVLTGTVDYVVNVVRRQYLPVENYLGGRGRSLFAAARR